MTGEKLKECIGLFGGLLSAILLFLQALGVQLIHFNEGTIDTFVNALLAAVPFVVAVYGVYKNSYIITDKAKRQEELLKEKGLK
ncbi:phage holin [Rummeliibacillus sp. NPDC094406]|uniref:phage holin n=1 Tax=Rummeliibacillus sp. NPDC094406 TaxID=3364511 RepID=UPI00381CA8BE